MAWSVSFAPLLPVWLLAAAGALALAVCALYLWRRQRGGLLRALAFALVLLALANPVLTETDRTELPGVAAVIVDSSGSQTIANRDALVEQAREALGQRLGRLDNVELRWATVESGASGDGTALFSALEKLFADVPPDRIAGAMLITDGQVHDIPGNAAALGFDAPLHTLLTARKDERDRRVVATKAPRFGLVGRSQTVTFRVEDQGAPAPNASAGTVRVTVRRDGEEIDAISVAPGEDVELPIEIAHGGNNIFEFEAEPLAGELTRTNNRAVVSIEGVRENLRVLLVSGEPHAGERTWRNLLKSDAAVDLVHFTILRPPEKQDGTPINQLSLIALPTRELFSVKIEEFDLIILDRYQRRGVLPVIYFDNIARYVEDGGALLVASGPELAQPVSIYRSPLATVLPAKPTGTVFEEPYRAAISDLGLRHPVTRGLPGAHTSPPDWGRWFRSIQAVPERGDTIMSGPQESPLLVLSREGEGRVALLLSDHAWLWSRNYEGGGPQVDLLRRLSHWLMREPDLEEERLSAKGEAGRLTIERQTMKDEAGPVRVIGPAGEERTVTLEQAEPGLWRADMAAGETGLYRLEDGDHTAIASVGPINPKETAELIASAEKLAPLVAETGGGVAPLDADNIAGSVPRVTLLSQARNWAGNGWIGLKRTGAYQINGIRTVPLMSGLLALALLLAGLGAAWYREGR